MGEEVKKTEEEKLGEAKKPEEGKNEGKEEAKRQAGGGEGAEKEGGEAKSEAAPPPPPPEEVVMRVYMHCEGCARKVVRCLKGFEGVEEVRTECRANRVVVKGRKAVEDPMRVVERVQKKSGRKVELLSPLPPPPKPEKKEEEKPKAEEEKPKAEPPVVAVVLKVHMHCDACAQAIKKGILKMKGVQAAEPDLKSSEVTVKGVFEEPKLVEYVYKKTGKHATVVKQDPAEKEPKEAEKGKEAAKGEVKGEAEKVGGGGGVEEKDKKEGSASDDMAAATSGGGTKVVLRRDEFYQNPRYGAEFNPYPPQIFSDENPNACSVM